MKIERKFLTENKFSRPNKNLIGVKGIVIHWVGNAGTSALANRSYFENLKNQKDINNDKKTEVITRDEYASAHFIIGLDGEIIQCLPVDEMAYHVGAYSYCQGIKESLGSYPNNSTIGLELCHPDWTGRFTKETYGAAVELTATLIKQFNLNPQKDIYRHFDVTGKICPKYFVEKNEAWNNFKADVEKFLISIL